MKKFIAVFGFVSFAFAMVAGAEENSVSGIVASRLVRANGKVIAFLVSDPARPTVAVIAEGADAAALVPRNQVTLSGTPGDSALGAVLLVKGGSVAVTATNQPFKSQPIAASAFKDASASAGNYVQLNNVTFATEKFDESGSAQVKAEDGSVVKLLVSKSVAGRETPHDPTDVFGVVVKSGNEWQLVAARFLPVNRRQCQELATQRTCLTCHNPDIKVIGPAYRDVAAKYRNDPEAINKFIAQMENGGTGKWGTNVMISLKALVPPEDMKTLANWVYSYRWDAILAE